MSKILIITECRRYCFNFGEVLQATALNRFISDNIRKNCITISFENSARDLQYRFSDISKLYFIRGMKFELFRRKYIKNPVLHLNNKQDIENVIDDGDTVVVGSDCVWYEKVYNDIYFLDFNKKIKRIAYAPSLRDGKISNRRYLEEVSSWINNFDFISTREEAGSAIIQKLVSSKKVETVLDPTLLLESRQWDMMCAKKQEKTPYIFCYFLGKTSRAAQFVKQVSSFYNNNNIIWVGMENNDSYFTGKVVKNIGPDQFISYIKFADVVLTDSFHGCAFSILYHKQLYAMERVVNANDIYKDDVRIKNLFHLLGIRNRYKYFQKIAFEDTVINYDTVEQRLQKLRENSKEFLLNAVKA